MQWHVKSSQLNQSINQPFNHQAKGRVETPSLIFKNNFVCMETHSLTHPPTTQRLIPAAFMIPHLRRLQFCFDFQGIIQ